MVCSIECSMLCSVWQKLSLQPVLSCFGRLCSIILQEVTLDFFGCAVKACELSQHLEAMKLLSKQVKALQGE